MGEKMIKQNKGMAASLCRKGSRNWKEEEEKITPNTTGPLTTNLAVDVFALILFGIEFDIWVV